MRGYFGLGQLSATEKSDILDQHKSVYNGYQTMQPQVSNTQPLTVYDFAGDKEGLVVNNKGEVKKYTNMGINEQTSKKSMCECGGDMYEGECMECGYKDGMSEEDDSDWDATLMDGLEEETGHLDDIYKVRDLNLKHGDFDYVEGGGNDVDTFEGMHKNLYKEDESDDYVNYDDNFEDPDNEDDGFEDLNSVEMDEQGGNSDDMDVDNVEPAYDFESNGPDSVYPVKEYETMESAFSDEIDEVDISGSQGIYSDMDPAFDFDSEGPGKAGPYQEFSYEGETDEQYLPPHAWKKMKRQQDAKDKGEDFDDDEFDPSDYEGLDAMSSWEDIKSHFGDTDWSEIDEDLQESFQTQKNKIMEMFNRFNKYN
jgi:hypothetical protein